MRNPFGAGGIPGAPDDTDSGSDTSGGTDPADEFGDELGGDPAGSSDPESDDDDDGSTSGSSSSDSGLGGSIPGAPNDDGGSDSPDETDTSDSTSGSSGTDQAVSGTTGESDTDSSDTTSEFQDELGGDPAGATDPDRDTSDVEFSERQREAASELDQRFDETDIGPEDVVIGDGQARLRDDAVESIEASRRGAVGDLVGDPAGASPPDETTAADSGTDMTTAADDDADPGRVDRFVENRLDPAAASYTERVAEPVGDALADATIGAQAEQAIFGTDRLDRTFESAGESVAQAGNLPGIAAGSIRTAQAVDDAASRSFDPVTVGGVTTGVVVPNPAGQREVGEESAQVGAAAASQAASNPFETTGSLIGGAAVGVGSARATTGISRRVRGLSRDSDGLDAGSFFDDTRAQGQFGRQRSRGSTDTPEQTTIEQTIEEGDVTDTISSEEFVDRRTRNVDSGTSDLETQLQQMADEADELAGRQQTPRQRAEQRVPEADAFESPAARQREISRLEDRFRTQDMSDLDNRVVPRTGGLDETTRGRFGLRDPTADAGVAAGTTAQAFADRPLGAVESEPVLNDSRGTIVPGLSDGADTVSVTEPIGETGTSGIADAGIDTGTLAETSATTDQVADTTATTDQIADTTATADTIADATTTQTSRTRLASPAPQRTGRLRGDIDDGDNDGDDLDLIGRGADDALFENPTQSLTEVDESLEDDLGGLDGP